MRESRSKRATMAAKKKAIALLFLFVSGFLLGIAVVADDSSEKLQVTSAASYKYDRKEASKGIDPDEVVAYVISLFAIDSWYLGIEIVGGASATKETRISLYTWMPTNKSQIFTTYQDNQTSVSFKVYGRVQFRNDCHELGRFNLSGISPAPRGVPQIQITFEVKDGNLYVRAEDKSTKKYESITITNCFERLLQESNKKISEKKLVTYIDNMRNITNDKRKLADKITLDDKEKINRTLAEAIKWLDANLYREEEDYDELLKEIDAVCDPIIERTYDKIYESSSSS